MSAHPTVLFDAPGPRARRRILILNIVGILVILAVVAVVIVMLGRKDQLQPDKWLPFLTSSVWEHYLLPGLWATVRAAAIAIVLANVLGLVLGLGRLAQLKIIRLVSGLIVEFFRAVPVLVMMIFSYWGLSFSKVVPTTDAPFWAVIIGLTMYNGSVLAELVRSGVLNMPRGQAEAGLSVGLTRGQTLRSVLLPQALTAMMPSMVSQLVVILKDTALGFLIAYTELLRQGRLVGTTFSNLVPALMVTAAIFIVINIALTRLADRLAIRLSMRTAHPLSELEPTDEGLAPGLGQVHSLPLDPATDNTGLDPRKLP